MTRNLGESDATWRDHIPEWSGNACRRRTTSFPLPLSWKWVFAPLWSVVGMMGGPSAEPPHHGHAPRRGANPRRYLLRLGLDHLHHGRGAGDLAPLGERLDLAAQAGAQEGLGAG